MASISFPSGHPPSQVSAVDDDSLYSSSFDVNSSFQMNPLSSHPPRTPRTSLLASTSSAHTFNQIVYESKEGPDASQIDENDLDEEDVKVKSAESRVRREEVWREMFLTSNGRDKAFKLMQYSIRLYLYIHTSVAASRLLRRSAHLPWERELIKRLQSAVSGFSFTRKMLLLFNWLQPLTVIMATEQSLSFSQDGDRKQSKKRAPPFLHTMLHASPPVLLELVHAFADDVGTLSRLGLFGKRIGERADRFSDWCWLLATLVGLVENAVERQMIGNLQSEVESRLYAESLSGATAKSKPKETKLDEKELGRLQKQDFWLQISRAKLLMDLIFVSYDVFKMRRGKEPVKAIVGLTAAILSSARLYDRHRNTLVKNLMLTI